MINVCCVKVTYIGSYWWDLRALTDRFKFQFDMVSMFRATRVCKPGLGRKTPISVKGSLKQTLLLIVASGKKNTCIHP